jgi:hypothetical protein
MQASADFGSSIFREVVITTCWEIWKTRNSTSLMERAATFIFGRILSRKSLDWFSSRPSRELGKLSLDGVRISPNVLPPFVLALGAL